MKQSLPTNSYVELLEGREGVYLLAQSGSRGWIRKFKIDEHGYPMVYIEWDREHWKYNGEEDGWTYEDHFRQLEPPPPTTERVVENEKCSHCGHSHSYSSAEADRLESFIDSMHEGVEEALSGDGYVLVTVKEQIRPDGVSVFIPQVFRGDLTDDAATMLEAQIVHLASLTMERQVLEILKKMGTK